MCDELYPNGMTATEWYAYCRTRQRELFHGDGALLHYTDVQPTTASIAEVLMAKGMRISA
jgi:uncharacterized protein (DUF1684 family)